MTGQRAALLAGPVLHGRRVQRLGVPRRGRAAASIDLDAFDASRKHVALPNGISLAYVDIGPRDAPVILLIHGYTSNARGWVPLLPYLDQSRRYLIPDLRGHGQSSKPDCCYDRTTFAYDLRLLLDALHVERVDVVGTSLGSLIAQAFAENWPSALVDSCCSRSTGGPLAAVRVRAGRRGCLRFSQRDPGAAGSDRPGIAVHDCVVRVDGSGGR